MITIDASAVLAVLLGEPEEERFRLALAAGGVISPVNYWEVLAKAHRYRGVAGVRAAEEILRRMGVAVASIGASDAHLAYEAFARFGKGAGGPLNLGDCFAYAMAQVEGDGLLFKGDDFPKTDVKSALA